MKTKLNMLLIFISFSFYAQGQTQKSLQNCTHINIENYVFVDSVLPEYDIIDKGKAAQYINHRATYLLLQNNAEYAFFKTKEAKNIDFEEYNVLVTFFDSYGICHIPEDFPVKFLLFSDKWNNQHFVSIEQYIHVPYLKRLCPPYFVSVIIPKKYCGNICYTSKSIENE